MADQHYRGYSSRQPRRSVGRKKPIKSLTAYNYVVKFDIGRKLKVTNKGAHSVTGFYASPIREESYNVLKGELLFQHGYSSDYHDGVHVFSFANGLGHNIEERNKRKILSASDQNANGIRTWLSAFLLRDIQFVGVALTDFVSEGNNYQNVMQGFVATIGGVTTIVNSGSHVICPGQWVQYAIPDVNSYDKKSLDVLRRNSTPGIPLDKQVFETVPYRHDKFGDRWGLFAGGQRMVIAENIISKKDGLDEHAFHEGEMNRIIGKALSFARPGESFDLLLGGRPCFFA